MKKSYIITFIVFTLLLTGIVFASNDTNVNSDLEVSTSKETVKMGDEIDFTATKTANDDSYIIFKVNNKTVRDKNNTTIKTTPTDNKANITYTVPDGMKSGKVLVTAVTSINNTRYEANTYFNVEKMNVHFTNITVYRNLDSFTVYSVLLDENEHHMYGSTKVAIKINGKTLQKNNTALYFKASNGVINATFKVNKDLMEKDLTLTLVTGDTYSYIGSRHEIQNLKNGSVEVKRINIKFTNTTIIRENNTISINSLLLDTNNYTVKDTSKVAIKINGKTVKNNSEAIYFYAINGLLNATFNIDDSLVNKNINISLITGDTYSYIGIRQNFTSNVTKTVTNKNTTSNKNSNSKIASVFVKLYTSVDEDDVTKWVKAGITDVFVQTYTSTGETANLKKVIKLCKNTNIKVHAWILCFHDNDGWDYSQKRETTIKNFIKKVLTIDGVKGICLDYVRYSGVNVSMVNVTKITNFVKSVNSIVKNYNSSYELSACVFPEMSQTAKYYGQNYTQLAKYLDVIMPMAYKYDYKKNTTWITDVTKYIVDTTSDVKVVTIIMTYDSNLNILSLSELSQDIKSAIKGGSYGYSLFYKTLIKTYPVASNFF